LLFTGVRSEIDKIHSFFFTLVKLRSVISSHHIVILLAMKSIFLAKQ
jgi:hypothetical protein